LLSVVALSLFVLSVFMFSSSHFSAAEVSVFSSTQSTSTSIVFTQRETLAFTTKMAQWFGGELPKREVVIAKALLAQRLSVVNDDGLTTGELASADFIKYLKDSDLILEKTPDGLLPQAVRPQVATKVTEVIDGLLFESRQLTVIYQQRLDAQVLDSTKNRSRNTLYNLLALICFIVLGSIFLIWGFFTFKAQYATARKTLRDEAEALFVAEKSLKKAETTVKTLEELNNSKNDFISTVNHELRTPLTSIIGYIDLLKSLDLKKDGDKVPQITAVMDRNSQVLLEIIESILALSSLDSAQKTLEYKKEDLADIVAKQIFILKPLIDAKSIAVKFYPDSYFDFAILGNSGQISQVALNLLSNAIKFSPQGSTIHVYISTLSKVTINDFVKLEIKDQGIGIPQEDIPKLFTRFFRASNALSRHIEGTGLGLAIVSRIVALHKGTIRVESEVNKGSSFIVEFPRYVSEIEQHILDNRSAVLLKAIVAIQGSALTELKQICHQMAGALGFYELDLEMDQITALQLWMESHPDAPSEALEEKRKELVTALEESHSVITPILEIKP